MKYKFEVHTSQIIFEHVSILEYCVAYYDQLNTNDSGINHRRDPPP